MAVLNLNAGASNGVLYFEWLCERVELDRKPSYGPALRQLYSAKFNVLVPYDENRAADGIELRHKYEAEVGPLPPKVYSEPCTLLEMIIALAERMSFEIMDYDQDLDIPTCFWLMMENLGIRKNHEMNPPIIRRLNDRTYQRNGRGGLFPVNHSDRDQRDVELWYQMHGYILENF